MPFIYLSNIKKPSHFSFTSYGTQTEICSTTLQGKYNIAMRHQRASKSVQNKNKSAHIMFVRNGESIVFQDLP